MKTNRSRVLSPAFRAVFAVGCLAWGSYILAMFRSTGFGLSPEDVRGLAFATLVFVAPLSILAFLGLDWRRIVVGVCAICAGSCFIAESFSRAQEIAVVRNYGPAPTERVLVARWWPFEDHSIFYVRDAGWSGGD